MNTIDFLKQQFEWAHDTQEKTIEGSSDTVLHFSDIGDAIPVGAAYAHSVVGEDLVLSGMIANKKPVFSTAGEAGLSEAMPDMQHWDQHAAWYKSVKIDLPKLRQYAQKVYAATAEYLSGLKDEDLNTEHDMTSMGMGKVTTGFLLTNFLLLHTANLTGEISAAKGFQGEKGYPF